MQKNKAAHLAARALKAAGGLLVFAFGVYLTIRASIGLAPWDVLATGVSERTPLSYGDATLLISVLILLIDVCLREHIGLGMILDALIVGKAVDLYTFLNLVPKQESLLAGAAMMAGGFFIMAFGQWVYMSAGLGCGPRDSLLVALGKRVRKVPIGVVAFALQGAALLAGWLLGGPVGVGTVLSVAGTGAAMQLVFRIVRFEPRDVRHEGLVDTFKGLRGNV